VNELSTLSSFIHMNFKCHNPFQPKHNSFQSSQSIKMATPNLPKSAF